MKPFVTSNLFVDEVVSLFAQNSQNNYTLERAMIKLNQMASI
jgi:hypothetical protein